MPELKQQLVKYLTDAHGLEQQSLKSLEASAASATDPELKQVFEDHISETKIHAVRIEDRLRAHGADASKAKDVGNQLLSAGKGLLDSARGDNAGKNLRDAYIGEATEIVSYELLKRVAARAQDEETVQVAEEILAEERAAQQRLEACLDGAVDASLRAEGAPPAA